jgi:hypothetical protein
VKIAHQLVTAGQVILSDKGFAGADFGTFLDQDLGAPAAPGP